MDLDTAWLRALVAVADEAHFGRAAERLGITQQALSKRIARLEQVLGRTLVDRTERRRIRLTPRGEELLTLAHEVLGATDRIAARTASATRLRVDTMGDYLAPHQWVHRASHHGALGVDAVARPPEATADHLVLLGRADFSFGRAAAVPRPWPRSLAHRLVLLEPLAVACGVDHAWAARGHVRARDLAGQSLWFPLVGAPVEWQAYLSEFADAFGVDIDTAGSTFGYRQWLADVADGRVPPSLIGEAMVPADPAVVVVPVVDPTPVYPWSLFWDATRTTPDQAQQFLRALGFPGPEPTRVGGVWLPGPGVAGR